MWLQSVLVPLLRLYLCGIKVLIYQMFNKSFTLPGLVNLYFLNVCYGVLICGVLGFFTCRLHADLEENIEKDNPSSVWIFYSNEPKLIVSLNSMLAKTRSCDL